MASGPTGLGVDVVNGLDPNEPVVMLNLMKFRAVSSDGNGSGWQAFERYGQITKTLFRAQGAVVLWAGSVDGVSLGPEAEGDWDYAALAWYPRPQAFLDMMTSPEYVEANVHRENGTERHLILAAHTAFSRFDPSGA